MARNPSVRTVCGLGICLLALLCTRPLPAQLEPAPQAGGGGPATEPQSSPGGGPPASQIPRVVAVRSTNRDRDNPKWAGLGDGLVITLKDLSPKTMDQVKKGCEGLILFLDEIPIKGVAPDSCSLGTGTVRFTLDRTDESDKAWHALLEEPIAFHKTVSVSVGPEGDLSFPSDVDIELVVLPKLQFWAYFVGLFLFLLLLLWLAARTPLLRDRTPLTPAGKLPPYSLSRFQMAFWSFLIIAAYLFIWIITEELDTITGSVLALLGIGSSTALAATLIDKEKTTGSVTGGGEAQAPPPAAPPAPARAAVSEGFLRDVLSDDEGISLHRLQLFAWTLVLGIIFVASVYEGLQMPQFNPTLLGLMGISSGTYLGFKVPESRTPARVE